MQSSQSYSVEPVQKLFTGQETTYILRLLFVPAIDRACQASAHMSAEQATNHFARLTLVDITHVRTHHQLTLAFVAPPWTIGR
jgi:predicted dithiol-disulfide oxidoreductase (DUF899 family)